jgi:hypothetical protein
MKKGGKRSEQHCYYLPASVSLKVFWGRLTLGPLFHGDVCDILQVLRKEFIILVDAVAELYAELNKDKNNFSKVKKGRTLVYEKPVEKTVPGRDEAALEEAKLLLNVAGTTRPNEDAGTMRPNEDEVTEESSEFSEDKEGEVNEKPILNPQKEPRVVRGPNIEDKFLQADDDDHIEDKKMPAIEKEATQQQTKRIVHHGQSKKR